MKNYFCEICAERILQSQSVVRVVVEDVKKRKGDKSDPAEWSSIEDWEAPFLFHTECVRRALDEGIIFPCSDICGSVLLSSSDEDKKVKRHLRSV